MADMWAAFTMTWTPISSSSGGKGEGAWQICQQCSQWHGHQSLVATVVTVRVHGRYVSSVHNGMVISSSDCGGGEDLGQTHEHHDKGDHGHADDIVTDGCPNLQPAAIVSNQKEEVLKQTKF